MFETSRLYDGSLSKMAVLGSGTGSNFDAIADAVASGQIQAEIVAVVSDVEDAMILDKARARGLRAIFVHSGGHPRRFPTTSQEELLRVLQVHGVDFVVLAGFMRVLREPVLGAYSGKILNIHPSLLPKYPGLAAWEQALAAGETETGCTVHLVTAEVDSGVILGQERVQILPEDTPGSLLERIHGAEYRLYPAVLARFVHGVVL